LDPKLRIQLLGDFRLLYDEISVDGVDTPRLQSLVAYLLLHQDAPQSRHHLAFLFWPDSVEKRALTSFRNLLYQLRHVLPNADHFLRVDAKNVQWSADASFSSDVADLMDAVADANRAELAGNRIGRRAALERAVDLYDGDLLPSCYDEWILAERDRLRQTFIEMLWQLADLLEKQRDYGAAIAYVRRLLVCDPMQEDGYRGLMRLYALSGNRAAALRTYHACVTMLRQEFGADPDPLTQREYERFLRKTPSLTSQVPAHVELQAAAPLIGRERELSALEGALQVAVSGEPQLVVVSGEAGIGKTRLAEEFVLLAERQGAATAIARCYAAQGELPYAPVVTWLRTLPSARTDRVWLAEVARVLPELHQGMPAPSLVDGVSEGWRRQRLFEALAHTTLDGRRRMLVLLLDDLQWCDRDSLEWLHYLLCFDPQARLLVVGTVRIENLTDNASLVTLMNALRRSDQLIELELEPLGEAATWSLGEHLTGRGLDPSLARLLHISSEGNPLFIVEMLRMGAFDGVSLSGDHGGRLAYATLPLPPKVQTVLDARLAQLSPSARELADLAAITGREFAFTLLAQAVNCDEDTLVRDLDELWRRRILREQGADGYDFSHDKIREVAHNALSAARRRLLHRRVAQALEVQCLEGRSAEYAQVALHYECAGHHEQAIPHYKKAGEAAHATFAYAEATNLYSKALELLRGTPRSENRDQRELDLLLALGIPLVVSRGHTASEVGSVYSRAWELCEQLGDTAQQFSVLLGLRRSCMSSGNWQRVCDLGKKMLSQASSLRDPALVARAHMHQAEALYRTGGFAEAHHHSVAGYALYDSLGQDPHVLEYGSHTGVFCLIYDAVALQCLGYLCEALTQTYRALSLAEKVDHRFSSCMVLILAASLHRLRRDARATLAAAEAALKMEQGLGFPLVTAWGIGLQGWALVQQGHLAKGIEQMQQGIAASRAMAHSMIVLDGLVDLCETYTQIGNLVDADRTLNEAFTVMVTSELRCWEAELHRLRGEILLLQHNHSAADAAFGHAIAVAQRQEARLLELRASVSLSRMWQAQNKGQQAKALLEGIYGWFGEGLEAVDLQEAEALLRVLM
jgi:DNA-binding SARP family transcriptional activator/predicted ATPase